MDRPVDQAGPIADNSAPDGPTRRYLTLVCRGWSKESLARKIEMALEPWDANEIISIVYQDQPLYILGRRNSALITVRLH